MPENAALVANLVVGHDSGLVSPLLLDLRKYWNEKRGTRFAPARADIDPLELRGHLGNLFLVDVLAGPDDFRFRLIGTNIARAIGRDSTGKTVYQAVGADCPEVARQICGVYARVAAEKQPVYTRGRMTWASQGPLGYEALHLPLSQDGQVVNMILAELLFLKD